MRRADSIIIVLFVAVWLCTAQDASAQRGRRLDQLRAQQAEEERPTDWLLIILTSLNALLIIGLIAYEFGYRRRKPAKALPSKAKSISGQRLPRSGPRPPRGH